MRYDFNLVQILLYEERKEKIYLIYLNIKFKRMNNTFSYTNFYSYDLIYLEYLKFI